MDLPLCSRGHPPPRSPQPYRTLPISNQREVRRTPGTGRAPDGHHRTYGPDFKPGPLWAPHGHRTGMPRVHSKKPYELRTSPTRSPTELRTEVWNPGEFLLVLLSLLVPKKRFARRLPQRPKHSTTIPPEDPERPGVLVGGRPTAVAKNDCGQSFPAKSAFKGELA